MSIKIDNLHQMITSLHEAVEETKVSINFNASRIDENRGRMDDLEHKQSQLRSDLENQLLLQEVHMRKPNLLVYGIADPDIEKACRDLFLSLGVTSAHDMLFNTIHRLPRKQSWPVNEGKPLPIVVKFVRLSDRDRVYDASIKGRSLLRSKSVSIRTDLPVNLKKYRGKLASYAFNLRVDHKVQTKIVERGIDIKLYYRRDGLSQWSEIGLGDPVTV